MDNFRIIAEVRAESYDAAVEITKALENAGFIIGKHLDGGYGTEVIVIKKDQNYTEKMTYESICNNQG